MAKFYGIGVGPGDPELLTLKAANILKTVDVVLLPQTKQGKKGIAYTIIEPYLKENLECVFVDFPMVTDEIIFAQAGKDAAQIVEQQVQMGRNTAFVTLGDPSVYSSYGYILKALSKEIEVETIPGITSFCAAAAMVNRPLVEKDEILSILPMNATDKQIDEALTSSNTFAFMKIYHREERVLHHLKNHQMIENSVLVERCGFEEGRIHEDLEKGLMNNKDYLTLVLSRKGS
jgi:precorrin-2/cobalt-factor-2 C20-methyltransferase